MAKNPSQSGREIVVIMDFIANELKNTTFWRDYDIHILGGTGHQGRELVRELADLVAKVESGINSVSVWVRPNHKKEQDLFLNNQNYLFTTGKQETYNKLADIFKFPTLTSLDDLQSIVKLEDNYDVSSLLVITTRYNFEDLVVTGNNAFRITSEGQKQLSEKEVMHMVQTTFFNSPGTYKGCLQQLADAIDLKDEIGQVIKPFQPKGELSRIGFLPSNLIGINELGKAIKGYKGTVINQTNPVDVISYALAAQADIPVNRIIGASATDFARFISEILRLYYEHHKIPFRGKIEAPPILGTHDDGLTFDPLKIKFDGKTFNEVFGKYSQEASEILKRNVRGFGIDSKKLYSQTSIDTVRNSLIPYILNTMEDKVTKPIRGSVYFKDAEVFTGLDFIMQAGTIVSSNAMVLAELDKQTRTEFKEGTMAVKEITETLVGHGYMQELKPRMVEAITPTESVSAFNLLIEKITDLTNALDYSNALSASERALKEEELETLRKQTSLDSSQSAVYPLSQSEIPLIQDDYKTIEGNYWNKIRKITISDKYLLSPKQIVNLVSTKKGFIEAIEEELTHYGDLDFIKEKLGSNEIDIEIKSRWEQEKQYRDGISREGVQVVQDLRSVSKSITGTEHDVLKRRYKKSLIELEPVFINRDTWNSYKILTDVLGDA